MVHRQRQFRQLLVVLLQLGMLVFKVDLVLLEHAGLFLKFIVDGLEFFLLGLQILVQTLALGQYVLQLPAVTRGVDGVANIGGNHVQKCQVA